MVAQIIFIVRETGMVKSVRNNDTVDDEPTVLFEGVVYSSSGYAPELSRLIFSRFRGFSRKRFAFGYFY